MNENQLIDDLRGIGGAEPPLGFDPDRVADTAAKLHKRRRALLGVSIGTTLAVAATAFSVSLVLPGEADSISVAAPPPTPWPTVTKTEVPRLPDPKVDLSKQKERLERELPGIIKKVKPDAQVTADAFSQYGGPNSWDYLANTVKFTAPNGEQSFNLHIYGKAALIMQSVQLREQCAVLVDAQGKPEDDPEVTERRRCDRISQPDGSTVVVKAGSSIEKNMALNAPDRKPLKRGLNVMHFRTDGTMVQLYENPVDKHTEAMSYEQLIRLVANPGLNLK
ncbi:MULTISPECIES: hypothetical protein [unclassified Crossiella]|uniref:hypothetical protein n=1 Tax=unclassified Crossiella TaxID=2620835 RepID=UPI0020002C5F|nr:MULTISPECIES: hypothetical protein [unclassified Crossiella]MCK2236488.1 hypothetical protein [Crossiella sp. S99.2]MCK2250155.1 hypothetical protein [Crossiella sp. S99.1]